MASQNENSRQPVKLDCANYVARSEPCNSAPGQEFYLALD